MLVEVNKMQKILILKESTTAITGASDLFDKVKRIKIDHSKEHLIGIYLNTKNEIIKSEIISIGTLNSSLVHPREVFRPAIKHNANSFILAHNHPSGYLEPSEEDLTITRKIKKFGEEFGIKLLDHVIFNKKEFYSMCENDRGGL